MSKYSSIETKALSSFAFLKIKEQNTFSPQNTCMLLMNMLAILMAWYAAYRKLFILVEALPKLMPYEEYGNQQSDLEMKYIT